MVDPAPPPLCSNEDPERGFDPRPRVALAHDWIVARRGGEQVLAAIADALAADHDLAGLWTMFHNGTPISPTIDALPVHTSPLNALPGGLRRWLLPAYPSAVARLTDSLAREHARRPIDILISTSSSAIKAMRAPPGVPHVCYCHSPARYLWSQTEEYARGGLKGAARGAGLGLFRSALRAWDRRTADRVDLFIANSAHTREQIRLAYGRDAAVVHPPVRTDFFTPDPGVPRGEHLLVVTALEPYKRVDLAIRAAALARRELIIVGSGSHEGALRHLADRTPHARVRFVAGADDSAVRDHYRRARAFLMPQIEDFGITAVEAQACGTPVIARAAGGALDTVIDSQTGLLVPAENPEEWSRAIREAPEALGVACRTQAERFGPDRFRARIRETVAGIFTKRSASRFQKQA